MLIRDHHQRTIERLTATYRNDARFIGLIIGGSVAKGFARDDSDVDFMIVATDDAYAKHAASDDFFINRRDLCDYEGGFVDGKIIDKAYLNDVAATGNDPTRAAFMGAFLAYSHDDGLEPMIKRIPVYPNHEHAKRLNTFYCMAFIQHWLMHEAERHDNLYTRTRAASQLALFAGRLLLAHNRLLFPYHKWFVRVLEDAPDKPVDFMKNFNALLSEPNGENANRVFNAVREFQDWGVSDLEAFTWFMSDVEWSWRSGKTPFEDW